MKKNSLFLLTTLFAFAGVQFGFAKKKKTPIGPDKLHPEHYS